MGRKKYKFAILFFIFNDKKLISFSKQQNSAIYVWIYMLLVYVINKFVI